MRQAELTITLPPATDNTNGTITARTYPLLVVAEPGVGAVALNSVTVAPAAGLIEVWVGKGDLARRQVIERDAQLTQAVTDGFAPLDITLANLSTDTATQVVVSCLVYGGAGDSFGFSEPVRFIGPYPFGTSGQAETDYSDQYGVSNVTAQGAGFTAILTTDAPTVTHSIRELVALTRILNSSGGGAILTNTGATVAIIVEKDGTAVDSNVGTLDTASAIFVITNPTGGTIKFSDLAAASVHPRHLSQPVPLMYNGSAVVATSSASGTLSSTTTGTLAAGTYGFWAIWTLRAEGNNGAPGDGTLQVQAQGATVSESVRNGVRYEAGVDGDATTFAHGTLTLSTSGTIPFAGQFTPTSGTINSKVGGGLFVLIWPMST